VEKRSNAELIQPTLFSLDKPQEAVIPTTQEIVRPFEIPGTQILLGTSSFTASDWEGSFYPKGMKASNYLSYNAKQFRTVEIDSTFYGTPSARTVESWYEKTPADFVLAAKVPQVVTHDKVLLKVLKIFAFTNNHYSGYGPGTVKLFLDLWNKQK